MQKPALIALLSMTCMAAQTARSESLSAGSARFRPGADRPGSAVMGAAEITCLLGKIKVPRNIAEETGRIFEITLKRMNFKESEFNRVSMLHYLAMVKGESGAGQILLERNPPSAAKTGYGYIQVTGPANLKAAEKCAKEQGVPATKNFGINPRVLVHDKYLASMASFCWWRDNMARNKKHVGYTKRPTTDASRAVHQIANSGRVGGTVTDKSGKRQQWFQTLLRDGNSCRRSQGS